MGTVAGGLILHRRQPQSLSRRARRHSGGVDNCYGVAKAAADRRLNDVCGGLVNALKYSSGPDDVRDYPEILSRLIAAERAWIVFRNAECSYHSSYMLGGTGEDDADAACLYAQTKTRVKTLTAPDAPQNLR